jgi:hypothetical protein
LIKYEDTSNELRKLGLAFYFLICFFALILFPFFISDPSVCLFFSGTALALIQVPLIYWRELDFDILKIETQEIAYKNEKFQLKDLIELSYRFMGARYSRGNLLSLRFVYKKDKKIHLKTLMINNMKTPDGPLNERLRDFVSHWENTTSERIVPEKISRNKFLFLALCTFVYGSFFISTFIMYSKTRDVYTNEVRLMSIVYIVLAMTFAHFILWCLLYFNFKKDSDVYAESYRNDHRQLFLLRSFGLSLFMMPFFYGGLQYLNKFAGEQGESISNNCQIKKEFYSGKG